MLSDAATQSRNGPLAGITVLDFTTLVPGPLAGLMLAEAGAEVIKIEPLGGEGMRSPPADLGGSQGSVCAGQSRQTEPGARSEG